MQFEPSVGAMPDREQRPQGDFAIGPNGERIPTRRDTFEIMILAGRTGPKYSWQRVHPGPAGALTNAEGGGGTHDGATGFAYELNGRTNVAAGTVVTACWSDVGPWLIFNDPQSRPLSGPSGPGGYNTITFRDLVAYVGGACRLIDISITGIDLTGVVTDRGAI